jgi:hypothetical protein
MLNWLKRLSYWLREASILWLTIAVPLICIVIILRANLSEPWIRLLGLFLQLLGISTVLKGISDVKKLFNLPSLFSIAKRWFIAFPRIHMQRVEIHMVAHTGNISLSGRATMKHMAAPDASLEDRIRILESNLDGIDRRIIDLQQNIEHESRQRTESLTTERQTREHEITEVRTKLEATETGGLHISLMGLIWLCVGLIMSTASLELSHLF